MKSYYRFPVSGSWDRDLMLKVKIECFVLGVFSLCTVQRVDLTRLFRIAVLHALYLGVLACVLGEVFCLP